MIPRLICAASLREGYGRQASLPAVSGGQAICEPATHPHNLSILSHKRSPRTSIYDGRLVYRNPKTARPGMPRSRRLQRSLEKRAGVAASRHSLSLPTSFCPSRQRRSFLAQSHPPRRALPGRRRQWRLLIAAHGPVRHSATRDGGQRPGNHAELTLAGQRACFIGSRGTGGLIRAFSARDNLLRGLFPGRGPAFATLRRDKPLGWYKSRPLAWRHAH